MAMLLGDQLKDKQLLTDLEPGEGLTRKPQAPQSIEETGLRHSFIVALVIKHLSTLGDFTLEDVVDRVKLPATIIDGVLEEIQHKKIIEVRGSSGLGRLSNRYVLTDRGIRRAQELIHVSHYIGPAPVSLDAYRLMIEMQPVKNIKVNEVGMAGSFSHLVLTSDLLAQLGPAINSGCALFLYGPSGNGKTSIAEAIASMMPEAVYIPYAVLVDNDVIVVYDPVSHVLVKQDEPEREAGEVMRHDLRDHRWLEIERPVVMTGGELNLDMLDLEFNPITHFYQAPLQMKANNGIFIVDDFGRQRTDPQDLLNRWIIPLERHTDFLSLQSGIKFEIPFDQLVVFATNLEPKDLVDEAFLRRIRYKIKVDHPAEHEFEHIFRGVCESSGVEYRQEMLDFLLESFYRSSGRPLNACHPRDLINHVIDFAEYQCNQPELTEASLTAAWKTYFVDM